MSTSHCNSFFFGKNSQGEWSIPPLIVILVFWEEFSRRVDMSTSHCNSCFLGRIINKRGHVHPSFNSLFFGKNSQGEWTCPPLIIILVFWEEFSRRVNMSISYCNSCFLGRIL